jgi:hypothetical protein
VHAIVIFGRMSVLLAATELPRLEILVCCWVLLGCFSGAALVPDLVPVLLEIVPVW